MFRFYYGAVSSIRYRAAARRDKKAYFRALTEQNIQRWRTQVRVYDRNQDLLRTLDGVVGGQVDIDATSDGATRTASIQIADPGWKLNWDPEVGKIHARFFVGITKGLWVEELDDWMDVDLIRGCISRYERDGSDVSLEVADKAVLFLPPRPFQYPNEQAVEGNELGPYIRRLAHSMGETKFNLSAAGNMKISKSEAAFAAKDEETGLWRYMTRLAEANGCHLFYDGAGRLTMQEDANGWEFDRQCLLNEPSVGFDLSELKNQVVVRVAPPDAAGFIVTQTLVAAHPLSPQSLAVSGVDRVLRETVKIDKAITLERATKQAKTKLDRAARAVVDTSFESIVIPHLQEYSVCKVKSDTQSERFTLKQASIPLSAAEDSGMSVGFNKSFRLRKFKSKRRVKRIPKPKKDTP